MCSQPKKTPSILIRDVIQNNERYRNSLNPDALKETLKAQHPNIMLFDCSDSRVDTGAILGPEHELGEVFNVSKMGGTVFGGKAEAEYAIHHLGVTFLLVEGHSKCGAVVGSMGDFSDEPEALRHELDTIKEIIAKQPEDKDTLHLDDETIAILKNVQGNVMLLMKWFGDLVKEDKLTIVGTFHDIHNVIGGGHGREYIYSINGEVDAEALKKHPYLNQFTDAVREEILIQNHGKS